jgi:ATP-dependent Clp protease protease subunit
VARNPHRNTRRSSRDGKEGARKIESPDAISVEIDGDSVYLSDGDEGEIILSHQEAKQIASMIRDQIGIGNETDDHAIVFFTDEVETEGVEYCQRQILKLAFEMLALSAEERKGKYVTLIINSPGGSCDDGMALIDTIEMVRGMGIPVVGIAMGAAYSMAAVILQACSVRLVGRHARVMLHEVSAGVEGKSSEIEDQYKEIVEVNRLAASVFAERNTAGQADTQGWVDFMKGSDKYLSPTECVELGIADGVYEPLKRWRVEVGG